MYVFEQLQRPINRRSLAIGKLGPKGFFVGLDGRVGAAVSELEEREFYVHGNSATLLSCLAKLTGKATPTVVV